MAEVVTMFRNKMNGYNKEEVNLYVKDREEKLQEKDATITSLNEQVAELQKQLAEAQEAAKLAAETPAPAPAEDSDPILDAEIAEKAEKFDLLMKRWGDEEMGPAIAKKKVILEEAERAADVFYEKSAEKVAACLDADFAKLAEALRADLDAYLYSKSRQDLRGLLQAHFRQDCSGSARALRTPGQGLQGNLRESERGNRPRKGDSGYIQGTQGGFQGAVRFPWR